MNQSARDAALQELDRFVGEWRMTAGPPGGPAWPGEARVRFEWLDGVFLVERWRIEAAALPEGTPTSGTTVYGCDAAHGTYVRSYYDDRGVSRIYQMSLQGAEWTLWREPPPFAQRFRATFSPDGRSIAGRWELKEDGEEWKTDFDVTYTRVA